MTSQKDTKDSKAIYLVVGVIPGVFNTQTLDLIQIDDQWLGVGQVKSHRLSGPK